MSLQEEIERLEGLIADRRELYNDQVYRHNARIAAGPGGPARGAVRMERRARSSRPRRRTASGPKRPWSPEHDRHDPALPRPPRRNGVVVERAPHRLDRHSPQRERDRASDAARRAPGRIHLHGGVLEPPVARPRDVPDRRPRRRGGRSTRTSANGTTASSRGGRPTTSARTSLAGRSGRPRSSMASPSGCRPANGPCPGAGFSRSTVTSRSSATVTPSGSSPPAGSDLEPAAGALFELSTATISRLGWERERRVIELWNGAAHLGIV